MRTQKDMERVCVLESKLASDERLPTEMTRSERSERASVLHELAVLYTNFANYCDQEAEMLKGRRFLR